MPKIALLFPGQGAQTVGMGRDLAQLPAARQLFDRASEVLGYDLTKLCLEGPQERLDATDRCQPALFVTSLAALEKLRLESPEALTETCATAGLSLGEYPALVFAGMMTFEDGLRVVQERGAAMQAASSATPSGMLSVLGPDREQVESLCAQARGDGVLGIANLLCPGNIVVSGSAAAIERFVDLAERESVRFVRLAVAGAFHTSIMQPAVERLTAALQDVPMKTARIPVISNVDAQPHTDPEEMRGLLTRQIVSPVRWEECMRLMLAQGCDRFYEIGPGRVLRSLLKRIDRKTPCEGVLE